MPLSIYIYIYTCIFSNVSYVYINIQYDSLCFHSMASFDRLRFCWSWACLLPIYRYTYPSMYITTAQLLVLCITSMMERIQLEQSENRSEYSTEACDIYSLIYVFIAHLLSNLNCYCSEQHYSERIFEIYASIFGGSSEVLWEALWTSGELWAASQPTACSQLPKTIDKTKKPRKTKKP